MKFQKKYHGELWMHGLLFLLALILLGHFVMFNAHIFMNAIHQKRKEVKKNNGKTQ